MVKSLTIGLVDDGVATSTYRDDEHRGLSLSSGKARHS